MCIAQSLTIRVRLRWKLHDSKDPVNWLESYGMEMESSMAAMFSFERIIHAMCCGFRKQIQIAGKQLHEFSFVSDLVPLMGKLPFWMPWAVFQLQICELHCFCVGQMARFVQAEADRYKAERAKSKAKGAAASAAQGEPSSMIRSILCSFLVPWPRNIIYQHHVTGPL